MELEISVRPIFLSVIIESIYAWVIDLILVDLQHSSYYIRRAYPSKGPFDCEETLLVSPQSRST